LYIKIDKGALEKACKDIIESVLFCLPNAFKGTVYRISDPPGLIATRITSGVIDEERKTVSWGLPEMSDYNPPGKPWTEYRDEPDRPLEAMAWCVERQSSWTAEEPGNDTRSVRLQVEGIRTDFHHMEPVLIRKEDLFFVDEIMPNCPTNYEGETLWEWSRYIVVAVVKIHFRPYTIKIGGPETMVIKRVSHALGTVILSYQLRQKSLMKMRDLAADRLTSCNILADSLRNAITKAGLVFSLIKLELGFLRHQWEDIVLEGSDQKELKRNAVRALNETVRTIDGSPGGLGQELINMQDMFLELRMPPQQGENWVSMRIERKWIEFISKNEVEEKLEEAAFQHIEELKRSLSLGKDPLILAAYGEMPEGKKREWVDLIYSEMESVDFQFLDHVVRVIDDPLLNLPYKYKSKKSLLRLKALAEIIYRLEEDTNVVLTGVLNGNNGHKETMTLAASL